MSSLYLRDEEEVFYLLSAVDAQASEAENCELAEQSAALRRVEKRLKKIQESAK